jgi:prevent-host-death family protein
MAPASEWVAPARRVGACRICATVCYMRSVTHREMRNNSAEILRAVAAGESVHVTNRGVLAAVITPPVGAVLEELAGRGQARRPRRPLADLSTIRRRRASKSGEELIDESRGRW